MTRKYLKDFFDIDFKQDGNLQIGKIGKKAEKIHIKSTIRSSRVA